MTVVVNWNGKEVPKELRNLPQGRYVLQPVDELRELTPEEETGLEEAARELDGDEALSSDEVRARLEGILRR